MLFRSLLTLCLACLPIAAHAMDPAIAATRFGQAHRAVGAHTTADGLVFESGAPAVAALNAQWAAARDLVAALLDRQPGITPAALARQARHDAGLTLYALRLDPGAVLISVQSGAFGTAFIMQADAGRRHRAALSLDARPAAGDSRMPELAAWQSASAGQDCSSHQPEPAWSRCGPVAVSRLIPLPNEGSGARRFAILAYQVTPAGGTEREQISIWRWDGHVATPLLTRTLYQAITQATWRGRDARGFSLRAKENYTSLPACDECDGRQTIWRFDLPPVGAAPPRIRGVSPELDLVDRLYTRLFAHRPAADLAAPSVIAKLSHVELDMLNRWRYLGAGAGGARRLCVDALGFERPQIFRIVPHYGKLWIADVTLARPHACDGKGDHG